MRISEAICVSFLSLFVLLALVRSLSTRMRLRVIGIGFAGMLLLWVGILAPLLRDWIPAVILLLVYWQGGSFFSGAHERLQTYLRRFDEKYFRNFTEDAEIKNNSWLHRGLRLYWEIAYFFCYPLVPGAIAVLYFLGLREDVDFFWTVVLPPTFLCHLIVSFYQTHPPWKFWDLQTRGAVRQLNFLVLRHASIQINTFPSAHVAASMAAAFAVLHLHLIAGITLFFLAISITASTVIGRYHYGADAVFGFFLALAWYTLAILL